MSRCAPRGPGRGQGVRSRRHPDQVLPAGGRHRVRREHRGGAVGRVPGPGASGAAGRGRLGVGGCLGRPADRRGRRRGLAPSGLRDVRPPLGHPGAAGHLRRDGPAPVVARHPRRPGPGAGGAGPDPGVFGRRHRRGRARGPPGPGLRGRGDPGHLALEPRAHPRLPAHPARDGPGARLSTASPSRTSPTPGRSWPCAGWGRSCGGTCASSSRGCWSWPSTTASR